MIRLSYFVFIYICISNCPYLFCYFPITHKWNFPWFLWMLLVWHFLASVISQMPLKSLQRLTCKRKILGYRNSLPIVGTGTDWNLNCLFLYEGQRYICIITEKIQVWGRDAAVVILKLEILHHHEMQIS